MASIGGFTALYGSGRPYRSRAVELALIALAFAVGVGVGIWVAPIGWAVVIAVAAIAMIATWLSNALQIRGRPVRTCLRLRVRRARRCRLLISGRPAQACWCSEVEHSRGWSTWPARCFLFAGRSEVP